VSKIEKAYNRLSELERAVMDSKTHAEAKTALAALDKETPALKKILGAGDVAGMVETCRNFVNSPARWKVPKST